MTDSEFYRTLLRAYIDSANDGIFVLCDEMKFHVANPLLQSWLGVSEDFLTQHKSRLPIIDFIGNKESSEQFIRHFEIALTGKPVSFECYIHPTGADARWVEVNLNKVNLDAGEMFIGIARDVTQKKKSDEQIWQHANFDALTGLANRRLFQDRMEQEIKKAHRANLQLALIILDLDRFKEVNDTLGHEMGDLLLKEVAQRLVSCVREADTVARLGGDEFAVILGELEDIDCVERITQTILKKLSEPFDIGEQVIYISTSIGITLYPEDANSFDELLRNADQAMYAAKHQGRNRCSFYAPSMQEAVQHRMRLANDLRITLGALTESFRLAYQPIVELSTGIIHKAEALIRWQHPTRGLINPAEFIPIAEETQMILEIGDWVFHDAALQVAKWRLSHHSAFQVSINVSPVQIQNMTSFNEWFDYLQKLNLPGQSIVIEITEGLLLDANEGVTKQLQTFHKAGIDVSLDDFGTGYSSLSYLKKFNIDNIKIDQSFVRNLAPDSDDMVLCEAMIAMAHKLGIKVIAEGVETAEQRDLLAAAGCDYGQGYLFSKPLPAKEFEVFLNRYK
ncbi:sensor domain-containing protein [Sulfurirhabdus autotrophica]|uniref:PAS domain S-box-containing protein/diguanylate cyclase (GGDEF)-like protein n=1 Tax=Sulfurirhabdus autotrophica TaxID=1706046 RepID=A0A4R3YCA1_9PROT|nr:EAL domain-containing protein [Sulfurirhabdus autotrophica]TCV89610.1 PAS domain S-box-containing protein/diguanylate cyclase (GGDEF)-like protein [Sulfurirhabdus autotrophica]